MFCSQYNHSFSAQKITIITLGWDFVTHFFFKDKLKKWSITLSDDHTFISNELDNYVDDIDFFDYFKRNYHRVLFSSNLRTVRKKPGYGKKTKRTMTVDNTKYSIYNDYGHIESNSVVTLNKFFLGRYGIGRSITNIILSSSGIQLGRVYDMSMINPFFYKVGWSTFLSSSKKFFDIDLINTQLRSYSDHKEIFTYRGWCYLHGYPVHGQRRRSNYKTSRTTNLFSHIRAIKRRSKA